MTKTLLASTRSIGDSLISLADSFGLYVYASLFTRNTQSYTWTNRKFLERKDLVSSTILITLETADGAVGQAVLVGSEQFMLEEAFHLARMQIKENPSLSDTLYQLLLAERKLPPLLPSAFHIQNIPKPDYTCFEHHHHELSSHLQDVSLSSTVEVSQDNLVTFRSDGTTHSARCFRVSADHQLSYQQHNKRLFGGYSSDTFADLSLKSVADELAAQYSHFQLHSQAYRPVCEAIVQETITEEEYSLLLDSSIMAKLLFARLQHDFQDSSLVKITPIPAPMEGTLGYLPLHPLGFLMPPELLITQTGGSVGMNALYQQFPHLYGGHFHFPLPIVQQKEQSGAHLEEHLSLLRAKGLMADEPAYVVYGVQSLQIDKATDTFVLLPEFSYKCTHNRTQVRTNHWIAGSLAQLLSAIIVGVGALCTEHDKEHPQWTISLPELSLLSIDHRHKEIGWL